MSAPRRSTRIFLLWLVVGTAFAAGLQARLADASGGNWTILIGVSQHDWLRAPIEHELGALAFTAPQGHDGRYSFLMAGDPFNLHDRASSFDRPAYRYRRIFYPLLAGGGGLFNGPAALAGLIVLAALGMGAATAAVASLAHRLRVSPLVVLSVLANPGVWLSVVALTPDALALGLALSGLLLWWDRRHTWAIVILALAALTKEQYLLVAFSLAGWAWFRHERRQATTLALGAAVPLALWTAWLLRTTEHGPIAGANLALLGVLEALRIWVTIPPTERTLAVITLIGVITAAVAPLRAGSLLRWLAWPWVALALTTSGWVWNLGNNAARVFAPVWVFAIMSLAMWARHSQTAEPLLRPGDPKPI